MSQSSPPSQSAFQRWLQKIPPRHIAKPISTRRSVKPYSDAPRNVSPPIHQRPRPMIVQSEYSPYHILLSSNNIHEYTAILSRDDCSSTIPVNHWLGNPGRLDLMEYADEQGLALISAFHRVSSAEKELFRKRLRETSILRRAIHRSKDEHRSLPFHKAQQALAIARAVKKTIRAEKNLAFERIMEAELQLKTLRETFQAAEIKLGAAEQQIVHVMGTMDDQGLLPSSPVREPDDLKVQRYPSDPPTPHSVDTSNLSGFESYYDAPSNTGSGVDTR